MATNTGSREALESELADLITARTAILRGAQMYQTNARTLSRANLAEINRRVAQLQQLLSSLDIGHGGVLLNTFGRPV